MKGIQIFILFISVMLFLGCNPQQKAWEKVMVVHDEVMPKMGEMNNISKELKAKAQVIRDEVLMAEITSAIEALEKADEGMWGWMHSLKQLKALQKENTHDEIMIYLSEQLIAIEKVKADMENSMENGKKLLK